MRELLEEYVMLQKRLRDVTGELDTIKDKLSKIEPKLLEEFGLAGIQNVNCDGLTVFVKRERYVNKKSEADGITSSLLVERLRECGLEDLCFESYSASALKARVLAIIDDGGDLPDALAECINISEATKLGTRKA